jgi:hypothetical protein
MHLKPAFNFLFTGDFGTMIVHPEDGDEVAESSIFPKAEFIPGLGSISSFTHDPKRAELISKLWYEKHKIIFSFTFFSFRKQKRSISWQKEVYACYFDRAENAADGDASKERDLDGLSDTQEPKAMPPLTGTVKQNKGIEGTVLRQDNLISSASPGVASTMTKLNSSPSRKAFSVQDKVYAFWSDLNLFCFMTPK